MTSGNTPWLGHREKPGFFLRFLRQVIIMPLLP
jgi:hypothetical protein